MAPIHNSTNHRTGGATGDAQAPAVLNLRRPGGATSEVHPARPPRGGAATEELLPPAALRLPDLAATKPRVDKASQFSIGSIAQWAGIGCGALLAVWLIFGGSGSSSGDATESEPAPAPEVWNPPPLAPEAPEAPRWQAAATPAAAVAPSGGVAAPVPPAPSQPPTQDLPRPPDLPEWEEAARRAAPPAGAPPRPPVYTAERVQSSGPAAPVGTASTATPAATTGDAPPLGVTIPVPQ